MCCTLSLTVELPLIFRFVEGFTGLVSGDFTFDDRDTKLQSRWNFAPGSSPKLNSVQKMYHQNEIQMQEDDEFR
jgi:hypothetical protein